LMKTVNTKVISIIKKKGFVIHENESYRQS